MNTTYNLSPEEKLNVFASRYRPLEVVQSALPEIEPVPLKDMIAQETIEPIQTVNSETFEEPEIVQQPEVEDVPAKGNMIKFNIGQLNQSLSGVEYIKAHNGEPGLYKNKPDPKTV